MILFLNKVILLLSTLSANGLDCFWDHGYWFINNIQTQYVSKHIIIVNFKHLTKKNIYIYIDKSQLLRAIFLKLF